MVERPQEDMFELMNSPSTRITGITVSDDSHIEGFTGPSRLKGGLHRVLQQQESIASLYFIC